ncbi:hypothetical protein BJ508DRAFT_9571 [Ascobolus immersus RN42]|uniref:Uncharacterized protein n=1 Tax=Ascobolus immersus RN42 TaxID=1160509 RepID=A0A3N4HTJ2_ASCIM|nr:hypothetical protein BJ508DRAFT_9571 [Ascobolus immersus RN42]
MNFAAQSSWLYGRLRPIGTLSVACLNWQRLLSLSLRIHTAHTGRAHKEPLQRISGYLCFMVIIAAIVSDALSFLEGCDFHSNHCGGNDKYSPDTTAATAATKYTSCYS